MKVQIAGLLALAAVTAMPLAAAQSIVVSVETEHPGDHEYLIPDTRRLNIPMVVTVTASDFTCATDAEVNVQFVNLLYPDFWAGSSFNPSEVRFSIPPLAPGTESWSSTDPGTVQFDIFWDEDRPETDARQTYSYDTSTSVDAGGCVPPVGSGDVQEHSGTITAYMEDVVVEEGDDVLPCDEDPFQPHCEEEITPEAESPGVEAAVFLGAVLVLVGLIRRSRA